MLRRTAQGVTVLWSLCLLGCLHPVEQRVDSTVCELSAQPWDLQPIDHALPPPIPRTDSIETKPGEKTPSKLVGPTVPPELLPGGPLPEIDVPNLGKSTDPRPKDTEDKRRQAVAKILPLMPRLADEPLDQPGPEGRPLTLSDLQKLAMANSPLIRQATARVQEAQGAAIQVGLPPNPIIGYEGDQMGTTGGPGYQGGFVEQKVIVANKLQLRRAVATMD